MEENNIDLRSEEFQEILGDVPSWILRRGMWVLAITVVILLIGSAFFKYPEIISSEMELTGTTPPAKIVANTTGKLRELYVVDNQFVKYGTCIGIIDNPANTKDVFYLKNYLDRFDINQDTLCEIPSKSLQLGDMQNNFSTFYLTIFEYSEYKRVKYLSVKSNILKERISQYLNQKSNLLNQKRIIYQKLEIAKNKFNRDSLLLIRGVISKQDFEDSNNQYLESLLAYENISESLDNLEIQIGQMKESLFDTNYTNEDRENNLKAKLQSLITELKTGINDWELKYLLVSPIDGKVTFTKYWAINQNVIASNEIFSILPVDSIKPFGKAYLPLSRSGKVKIGQDVNIRFDSYPDYEFGIVKGIVRNISLVPTGEENKYVVEIELPDGLNTTYQKILPYNPNSHAQADIITEKMSLLERFFMPLRKIITENL